jgi:hypothetical protein
MAVGWLSALTEGIATRSPPATDGPTPGVGPRPLLADWPNADPAATHCVAAIATKITFLYMASSPNGVGTQKIRKSRAT